VTHVHAAKFLHTVSQIISVLEEKETAVIMPILPCQATGTDYKNKSKTNRYSPIGNIIVF
jgi:hypothetical protein